MVHSPPKSYRSWENQSYLRLHLLLQVTGRSMRWRRRFGGLRKETRSLVSAGPTHILDERQPCQAKAEGRRRGTVRTESEPDLHSAAALTWITIYFQEKPALPECSLHPCYHLPIPWPRTSEKSLVCFQSSLVQFISKSCCHFCLLLLSLSTFLFVPSQPEKRHW